MYWPWTCVYAIQFLVIIKVHALNIVPVNRTVIERNGTRHIISKYLFVPQDNTSDPNQTLSASNDETFLKFLKEFESSKKNPNSNKNVDTYKIYIKRKLNGKPEGVIRSIETDAESKDFNKDKDSSMISADNIQPYKTINTLNITILRPETDSSNDNHKNNVLKTEHAETSTLNLDEKGITEQIVGIPEKESIFKKSAIHINVTKVDENDELNDASVRVISIKEKDLKPFEESNTREIYTTKKQIISTFKDNDTKQLNLDELFKNLHTFSKGKQNESAYLVRASNGENAKTNIIAEKITDSTSGLENHDKSIIKNLMSTLHEAPEKYLDKTLEKEKKINQYTFALRDKAAFNETQGNAFENNAIKEDIFISPDTKLYKIFTPNSSQINATNFLILKKNMEDVLNTRELNNYPVNNTYLLNENSSNFFILANHSNISAKVLDESHNEQERNTLRDDSALLENNKTPSNDQEYKLNSNEDEYELLHEFSLHGNTSKQTKVSENLGTGFYENQKQPNSLEDIVKGINLTPSFENITSAQNILKLRKDTTKSFNNDNKLIGVSYEDILQNGGSFSTSNEQRNGIRRNNLNPPIILTLQRMGQSREWGNDISKTTNIDRSPKFIKIKTVNRNLNNPNSYYKLHSVCPECRITYDSQNPNNQYQPSIRLLEPTIKNYIPLNETKQKLFSNPYKDILSQNSQKSTQFSQNFPNVQANQQKANQEIQFNVSPWYHQNYNKIHQINSKELEFTSSSDQMPISVEHQFSIENLIKVLEALERDKRTKYDRQLFNMYMIIKLMLVTATAFKQNDETKRFDSINPLNATTKDYIYKLMQQKWLQEIMYQLHVNDYNVDIIRDPRWRTYLNDWALPMQYQNVDNYNKNIQVVDYNYDTYQDGLPQGLTPMFNKIRPYITHEIKLKREGNVDKNQYQRLILGNAATYLKNKGYSDCFINKIIM